MKKRKLLFMTRNINLIYIILIGTQNILSSFTISQKPICTIYTPDSILKLAEKPVPFQLSGIETEGRYSTCGGSAWFHNDYIATINFGSNTIHTYKFNRENNTTELFQTINNQNGAFLSSAELISISDDEELIAIGNLGIKDRMPRVTVYSINKETHLIEPIPHISLNHDSSWGVHGVGFSSSKNFFAFTCIDHMYGISFFKIIQNSKLLEMKKYMHIKKEDTTLKPKSLYFSQDETFLAILYSPNFEKLGITMIEIYDFDKQSGNINKIPKSKKEFIGIVSEDLIFLKNESYIAFSDQAKHRIMACTFNKETGALGEPFVLLKNPDAEISFPHGIGLSKDEKYLAVSNYDDDKVTIYQLE